ncbi:MAG TPA: hypothetical protein VJ997_02230, partial [Longimicrobiales bacterium]|nr:hypothetical protein [Longimicrobiales bacterium]
FRARSGPKTALAVVLLTGTSYVAYFWTTVGLHSEIPYFTVSVGALLLVHVAETASSRPLRTLAVTAGVLLVAYLPLVRTIGIALAMGLALWIALPRVASRREGGKTSVARLKRWAPAVLLGVTVLGAWMTWTARNESRYGSAAYMSSYVQQFMKGDPYQIDSPDLTVAQVPMRVVQMFAVRTRRATAMILNVPDREFSWTNPIALPLLLGMLAVTGVGFLRSFLNDGTLVDCYVLAYGTLLLGWPFDEGWRFLFPIQPFLLLYAIHGLNAMGGWFARVSRWRASTSDLFITAGKAVLLTGIVATGMYQSARLAAHHLTGRPTIATQAGILHVAAWIEQNTAADVVIMSDQPAILHRLTRRRVYPFPLFTDAGRMEEVITASGGELVVVMEEEPHEYFEPSTQRRFEAVRARVPEMFEEVHEFDQGRIFRVRRRVPPPDQSD